VVVDQNGLGEEKGTAYNIGINESIFKVCIAGEELLM
jgi:hypothetical protein